ncbi:ubiquilin [Nematocida parisii]|uniref:Ubiquitin-like domain-containing protein n=1 Tax=Nematocida parisii (strain ERTm3) TaxID=935791 RepID=I3EHQ3_NEMP3|nr:uncharacterized protein NEPG_00532 [Nematocida parisii ERTm1]EIJ88750.1 hypothetical protein NEQG_01440 [Nematocida parisii ERTm3]KAI5131186.1 ubiquilin [Nematocida parisii]EIJ95007.1 hypothetical protein NEPG_00532 [Nematocida parisii ERTm1]KAI5131240.1 ubiquilin [Nematocida parisii]KAI5140777.1 ubiquilin [Nematocida parisii]|eukprot:XP_013058363.1 hypothetical protein NEPG_00532 [Nematocida parisii ERTm1]
MSIMKINIKTSKGEVYSVEVEGPESTVLQLKEQISEKTQIPTAKIRLIHVGKLLKDQEALKTYKLEEESTVHLVVPSSDKKSSPVSSASQPSAQASTESKSTESLNSGASNSNPLGGGPGQMDPQFLKNMQGMNGNNSEMQSMMQSRMKELMKNPEQMKVLMEASLSMQNVPEPTKKAMMESVDKFAEMAKTNPEQFETFMNHMLDNPNMYMNQGMGGIPGFGQGMGMGMPSQAQGSQQTQMPAGLPTFNREEALQKYKSELMELEQIGYNNVELNLVALVCSEGDLTKAVNLIMDWTSEENH